MKVMIIILLICSGCTMVSGQNRLDREGRKTGPWKMDYPDGGTMYEASFRAGRPVGLMVRYYESGAVQARMVFDSIDNRCYTELFSEKGKKAAEGWHVDRKKDSVWTYYSGFDGTVRIKENYENGVLNGKACSYYPTGGILDEVNWREGSREGSWNQYFEDGTLRLRGAYENDMLNGPYEVYYPGSTLMIKGLYKDDLSQGTWSFYDETGELLHTLEYKNGIPLDLEKHRQMMNDILLQADSIVPQPFLE
jgi:antitoxin component YwqK of YwqJK toxin-antitoxin module